MTRDELDVAIEWAAAEGWNPGRHDANAYYAVDPGGYFIGLLDGEPVASVSAVKYSPEYAFMGFFIVKPEHRGSTLGPRLAEHAFRHVGSAVAGLDGVLEQAQRYAGIWGFEDAYHNQRYQGIASSGGALHSGIGLYMPSDRRRRALRRRLLPGAASRLPGAMASPARRSRAAVSGRRRVAGVRHDPAGARGLSRGPAVCG